MQVSRICSHNDYGAPNFLPIGFGASVSTTAILRMSSASGKIFLILMTSSEQSHVINLTCFYLAYKMCCSFLHGFAKIIESGLAPISKANLISSKDAQSKEDPSLTSSLTICSFELGLFIIKN